MKAFIFIVVYNHPDKVADFLIPLESILIQAAKLKVEIHLTGDFNINLLESKEVSRNLRYITSSHNLTQVIKKPTRVTEKTKTLIDHYYVSNKNDVVQKGVFSLTESDHRTIFIVKHRRKIKFKKKKCPCPSENRTDLGLGFG